MRHLGGLDTRQLDCFVDFVDGWTEIWFALSDKQLFDITIPDSSK